MDALSNDCVGNNEHTQKVCNKSKNIFEIVLTSNDPNILKCSEIAKDKNGNGTHFSWECSVETRINIAEQHRLSGHEKKMWSNEFIEILYFACCGLFFWWFLTIFTKLSFFVRIDVCNFWEKRICNGRNRSIWQAWFLFLQWNPTTSYWTVLFTMC